MTYEEIEKTGFVELRKCSLCNCPIGYEIHPNFASVVFNSSCDCSNSGSIYRLVDRNELVKLEKPQ